MTFSLSMVAYIMCVVLSLLLGVFIHLTIKMGMTVLAVEDTIEECLDILDERYNSISKILEIPIFFDSVEVRRVVDDINASRNAILIIANKLADIQTAKEMNSGQEDD